MSLFSKNKTDDEIYEERFGDSARFNSEHREEWMIKREYARDIASGLSSGLMCRDEDIWDMVREIRGE